MSTPELPTAASTLPLDDKVREHAEGVSIDVSGEDEVDRRLAEIEMAGEEAAIGFGAGSGSGSRPRLAPEVRYLHVSRTIHQLVTDRNRSVGIFLFVGSVLFGASTALLNVQAGVVPILPLAAIQYWCLPVTFGTLAGIGLFVSLILIRSRIGLIYEVAKLNVLLGLPIGRVARINPLSVFYLMHLLVVMLGGASAGFTAAMLAHGRGWTNEGAAALGLGVALAYVVILEATYFLMILHATSETKLDGVKA
jgi:hypothetical protein